MQYAFWAILAIGVIAMLARLKVKPSDGTPSNVVPTLMFLAGLAVVGSLFYFVYPHITAPKKEIRVSLTDDNPVVKVVGVNSIMILYVTPERVARYLCITVEGAQLFSTPPTLVDTINTGDPRHFVKEFDKTTKDAMHTLGITEVKVKFVKTPSRAACS